MNSAAQLLAASDIVTVAGKRCLRLKDQSRAEIVKHARGTSLFEQILAERTFDPKEAGDPAQGASMWLKRFLRGVQIDLANLPSLELKAALEAHDRLRLVEGLSDRIPSADELSRRVEMADLLEPLRLLVGARRLEGRAI